MKPFYAIILIAGSLITNLIAQPAQNWKRIETEDFSISIPPTFLVDAEKKANSQTHSITAFQKGVSVELEVSKPSNPKGRLQYITLDNDSNNTSFKQGNFEILRKSSKTKIVELFFLASKKNFYVVKIESEKSALEVAQRIMVSIKLEGKPIFAQDDSKKISLNQEENIKISDLKTSLEVTELLAQKHEKQSVDVVNKPLKEFQDDIDLSEIFRPVLIIDKPNPNYRPSLDSINRRELMVKMKVTFLANGKIGNIITYSNSDSNFVSSCVEAAKKIKFLPAQKDGTNIDFTFVIQYRIMSMVVASPGIRPF